MSFDFIYLFLSGGLAFILHEVCSSELKRIYRNGMQGDDAIYARILSIFQMAALGSLAVLIASEVPLLIDPRLNVGLEPLVLGCGLALSAAALKLTGDTLRMIYYLDYPLPVRSRISRSAIAMIVGLAMSPLPILSAAVSFPIVR